MDFPLNSNACLGILVPKCLQELLREPPISLPTSGDVESLKQINVFGTYHSCDKDEIRQARNLASGPSDVVIILDRPSSTHNYKVPFDQFVKDSPTLRAVDDLVRLATKGARSIHTVTVLNAYSFKPLNRTSDIPDLHCHQLLGEIIMIRQPKVVIRCHRSKYIDPWMQRFQIPVSQFRMEHRCVPIDGCDSPTIAFQSFHPSVAVNKFSHWPEYRALLMHHFVAAFNTLHGGRISDFPPVLDELRRLCTLKLDCLQIGNVWEAERQIVHLLQEGDESNDSKQPSKFSKQSAAGGARDPPHVMGNIFYF